MRREVRAASNFFKRLAVTRGKLDPGKAEMFAEKLFQFLCEKYANHWYVDSPNKGQAYRCIRINKVTDTDEVVLKACVESGVTLSSLGLPRELTVWIDPLEVCVRSAESGRPFSIARFNRYDGVACGSREQITAETSDYHSETSSDSSSIVSSDIEEDQKEMRARAGNAVPVITKMAVKGTAYKIAMVPRIRPRPAEGPPKVKIIRPMVSNGMQYMRPPPPPPPPQQVWTYPKPTPVFLTPVCAPMMPPPPPQHQQVYGYFVVQQPSPPFVVPQANGQPWEVSMG